MRGFLRLLAWICLFGVDLEVSFDQNLGFSISGVRIAQNLRFLGLSGFWGLADFGLSRISNLGFWGFEGFLGQDLRGFWPLRRPSRDFPETWRGFWV